MNNYKAILIDLDDTILSFKKGEDYAIRKVFNHYGIEENSENVSLYSNVNISYWEKLERKEILKADLLILRFVEFFRLKGIDISYEEGIKVNDLYFDYLTSVVFPLPDSIDTLRELKKRYKIFIITNGVKKVQDRRLKLIPEIFEVSDKIYISEVVGYEKPDPRFLSKVLEDNNLCKDDCVIVGDSLTSDMQLGINTNADTIWFNPNNKDSGGKNLTYIINDIKELLNIL